MMGEEQYRCWDDLLESVRTGETAFDRLYGRPFFNYLGEHPEQAKIFDAAMTGSSGRATRAMLDAYDLSGVGDPGRHRRRQRHRTWPPPSAATRRCGAFCSTCRTLSSGPARG